MPDTGKLPIGVFDSGVGGLTVVRALMERLPLENIVYFGDTARVPYGVKSVATIEHFTGQITDHLLHQGVKMLIIACNTMAAVASHVVKDKAGDMPVLDVIDAGARAAVAESRSRAIGPISSAQHGRRQSIHEARACSRCTLSTKYNIAAVPGRPRDRRTIGKTTISNFPWRCDIPFVHPLSHVSNHVLHAPNATAIQPRACGHSCSPRAFIVLRTAVCEACP